MTLCKSSRRVLLGTFLSPRPHITLRSYLGTFYKMLSDPPGIGGLSKDTASLRASLPCPEPLGATRHPRACLRYGAEWGGARTGADAGQVVPGLDSGVTGPAGGTPPSLRAGMITASARGGRSAGVRLYTPENPGRELALCSATAANPKASWSPAEKL